MALNAPSSASSAPGLSRRTGLFLFLAVVLPALPQAALLPLIDRDEPHFSEASREMIQSGNFIVPTFNHEPRYNKPPLIYWCQALVYTVFGENPFAARLPSLLATAGTAVILAVWGAELGSEAMGLGAGLLYAFCFQTIQQGRVATADGLLIFFMTLTAFAGWKVLTTEHASRSSRRYFWDSALALGFAGGFLAKGPEALLPFVPMLVAARGLRRHLVWELTVNLVLGLAIVAFWAIPAYVMTNGDYWRAGLNEGLFERMVTSLQGHGASTFGWYLLGLPFYLLLFWVSALPWSPLLVTQRKKLFTAWKPDLLDTYLLLNAGLVFVIFTLMVTKLPHYTLPAFPFLTLLLARRWQAVGESPRFLARLGWISGIVIALLTVVLIPLLPANHLTPSPVGTLVREARGAVSPTTQFALADFQEPSGVWEIRAVSKAYVRSVSDAEVVPFLNQPGPRAVVLSTQHWHELQSGTAGIDPAWKTFTASGLNSGKGRPADLTLVVKP